MPVKVSVIIPVYNAENFLQHCIDSVTAQTLQEIEIIIVNDGCTDKSGLIMQQAASSDNRIVIIDSLNEGVSAARNKALSVAKGAYTGFMDADDWAEPSMFEKLHKAASLHDASVAVCNLCRNGNTYKTKVLSLKKETKDIAEDKETIITEMLDFKYDYSACNKIYRNDLIAKYHLRFEEKLKVWEDLLFNLHYMYHSQKIAVIADCLYNYRVNDNSVTAGYKDNLAVEYNRVFENYLAYLASRGENILATAFTKKMAGLCYYSFIPLIVANFRTKKLSFFSFVKTLQTELSQFNPAMFVFNKQELSGLQGFKKTLLTKRSFRLYAVMVGIKYFFQK